MAVGPSKPCEAVTRMIVDRLVISAFDTAASNVQNALRSNLQDAQPIYVQCERNYKFGPLTLDHQKVILSGRPDYGLWYGESEAFCLSVLVVEAKGQVSSTNPIPQPLGYMEGCLHQARKNEGKRNYGVYGMAYKGNSWHFLKISHGSKWSEFSTVGRRAHLERPYGLIVWMLKKAALISPTHSKQTSDETNEQTGDGITIDHMIER